MPEYKCDMKGYASKYGFYTSENLSRMEAERTLQLEPEPPKESDLNNYIIQAQQQKNILYPKNKADVQIKTQKELFAFWGFPA